MDTRQKLYIEKNYTLNENLQQNDYWSKSLQGVYCNMDMDYGVSRYIMC